MLEFVKGVHLCKYAQRRLKSAINVSFDEMASCLAIFGTINFKTDMKKIILMALIAAPIWAGAQNKTIDKGTAKPEAKELQTPGAQVGSKSTVASPESIFAELIVSENQMGGMVIRIDFGRDALAGVEDKEFMMKIKEARELQFVAVPDALTYMNSIGFKFVTSYVTTAKSTETHMVLEKRMARKGDNGKGGPAGNGAERPERPEGSKPSTGTGDKKPAPSPTKSEGKK
jgi:TfoX/Sxy family transcriptional regulator of competence genes